MMTSPMLLDGADWQDAQRTTGYPRPVSAPA
jgi:hypothetical protein